MGGSNTDDLHLLEDYRQWKPEEVEAYLDLVRMDALYVRDYALELSRRRKRPVLVLCNARSATLLSIPIASSLERIAEVEEEPREAVARYRRAQEMIEGGMLREYIAVSKDIKVSSYRMYDPDHQVMATPRGLEKLLREGCCDVLFIDYSKSIYPGSFSGETGSAPFPGFKEFVKGIAPRYGVLLCSKRAKCDGDPWSGNEEIRTPAEALDSAVEEDGPVALCLNALECDAVYTFADNHPELLGEFGYRIGSSSPVQYRPWMVETTAGEMDLSEFVRRFLKEGT